MLVSDLWSRAIPGVLGGIWDLVSRAMCSFIRVMRRYNPMVALNPKPYEGM